MGARGRSALWGVCVAGAVWACWALRGREAAAPQAVERERAAPAVAVAPAVPPPTASALVALPAPPQALRFELRSLGRAPDGREYAWISVNGSPAHRHRVGDSLGLGVRLRSTDGDGVKIERASSIERLALPAGAARLAPAAAARTAEPARLDDPQGVIARPLDAPLPSSTPLERAIQRASTSAGADRWPGRP